MGDMRVSLNTSLSTRTSLRVGGPVALWCELYTGNVFDAVLLAEKTSLPLIVLGGGTNVLASDAAIDGLVVRVAYPSNIVVSYRKSNNPIDIRVFAPATWDNVVRYTVGEGWQGLECLAGIPGTVGAAPVQNIGAYGQQVSDTIMSVTAVDLTEGRYRTFSNADCHFGYRTSIFNLPENRDRFVITEVEFRLRPNGKPCRTHPEVAQATRVLASLTDVRNAVLTIRKRKGMLAEMVASAGSFFKNPIVTLNKTDELLSGQLGGTSWFWFTADGVKLSAARLIEAAGFPKGYTRGTVGISPYHPLALVNLGSATADDICGLARDIQEKVLLKFGVLLDPEVRLIGFQKYPLLT